MNTFKKEGISEAKRWRKVVECETYKKEQSKYVLRKPETWVKIRVTTEPESKYYVKN